MSYELTDLKRYELELSNVLAVFLDAARRGITVTDEYLEITLGVDAATVAKLVTKLKAENIIVEV
uniref:MarR family transcriptional regulator n=1 Tax=viral metagenome TaxID=1070528 RepID=A0A6M3IIL5_9ZZZZ